MSIQPQCDCEWNQCKGIEVPGCEITPFVKDARVDHFIKIKPEWFDVAVCGLKRFEVRRDDRDYQAGHIVEMRDHDGVEYTGRSMLVHIDYVLRNNGLLQPGMCVWSWSLVGGEA